MDVYVIAGPNGAGKTTFAREFLPKYGKGMVTEIEEKSKTRPEFGITRKGRIGPQRSGPKSN
jgi:ABC-type Mn2+/Zn2+ transport system ATPase subunit